MPPQKLRPTKSRSLPNTPVLRLGRVTELLPRRSTGSLDSNSTIAQRPTINSLPRGKHKHLCVDTIQLRTSSVIRSSPEAAGYVIACVSLSPSKCVCLRNLVLDHRTKSAMASPPPPIITSPSDVSINKGKQRVSFAADVNTADVPPHTPSERSPLLTRSRRLGEDEEEEDDEEDDQVGNLPSRLHRKLKKGLILGGSRAKRAGKVALPSYRGERPEDEDGEITTQKLLLYSVMFLIVVAVILGGVVLVQSTGALLGCP